MEDFATLCVIGAAVAALISGARLLYGQFVEAGEPLGVTAAVDDAAAGVVMCGQCGRRCLASELVCPHCGEPPKIRRGLAWIPLVALGLAGIAYTGSAAIEGPGSGEVAAGEPWSKSAPMQRLRLALITELERSHVIDAIRVGPHIVTVEVEEPAFRALKQFEQQTVGGAVYGYYFDGRDAADFVALQDTVTHQGVGWFNRWGLQLAEPRPPAPKPRKK